MVATPVRDRTPVYEAGEWTKGECPRCLLVRHMMRRAPACSGCLTPGEVTGLRLREEREKLGVSQQDLALQAGVSKFAIWTIENGWRKKPRQSTLDAIQEALEFFKENLPSVEEIVRRRKALRVSQSAVAQHAGIASNTLCQIESGAIKRPSPDILMWVRGALDKLERTLPSIDTLKQRRLQLGMSLVELADASDILPDALWRIESGRAKLPNHDVLRKLDKTLSELDTQPPPAAFDFKRRRELLGLSQADISRLSCIHRDTISEIERGRGNLRAQTLAALHETLSHLENLYKCGAATPAKLPSPEPLPTPQEIRARRQALGVTQRWLAERADIAPSALSFAERGKRRTWPRTLRTIDKTLRYFEERVAAKE